MRAKIPEELEVETFCHGAMCVSYSGRCLLSNYMTGRDSNRGQCAQPCRYQYALMEEKRPGEYFPVFEDEKDLHHELARYVHDRPFRRYHGRGHRLHQDRGRAKSATTPPSSQVRTAMCLTTSPRAGKSTPYGAMR